MSTELYSREIMRLAADATGHGRLAERTGTATITNPLCGDRITVDVAVREGRLLELRHEARACVLCQAAASLLAHGAQALSAAAMHRVVAQVGDTSAPWPSEPPGIELFAPVRAHRSRLRCVTLPFKAALAAMETKNEG
jgi:nitrogen fixation NifU-like protein